MGAETINEPADVSVGAPPRHERSADATATSGDEQQARPSGRESALFVYLPFLLTVTLTFASTSDDPFITLRYAANLVHGLGFAFNQGQHVQGFTSPVHLLIAVVAYVIPGGHDLLKLKLASLLFALLALHEISRLIFGLALPRWAKRTACVAVAMSWIVAFASGNGLETTIAVWLLAALARRLVQGGPSRSTTTLAVLAFVAVLTRLDTVAPMVCMAAVGLLIEPAKPLWRRCSWLGGALFGALVTVVGEELFFHSVLPNTYYAKDLTPGHAFSLGLEYLINPLLEAGTSGAAVPHGIPAVVLLIQIAFTAAGIYAVARRFPRCPYLVAIFVGQALFILKSGSDWMRGGRFLAPAMMPLIVVEVLGLVTVVSYLSRRFRPRVAHGAIALGAAALVTASLLPLASVHAPAWTIRGLDDTSLLTEGHYGRLSRVWVALADDLRCVPKGQLVATSEVGFLGFSRLDLRIIDLRGLTDSAIAKHSRASVKFPWGVRDPTWYLPTSPVGRALLRENPVVIATFDGLPQQQILRDRYHLVKVSRYSDLSLAFYVRTNASQVCPT